MSEEIIWTEDNNEDADWLKGSTWDLPTKADEFLRSLGNMTLEHFMNLPAAKAMPDELREELLSLGHSEVEKKQ
jgi:hypothetical protein